MAYHQHLQRHERSDPQGYNNWGSSISTPNNQAAQRRAYQTPPNNKPPLPTPNGRQGAIYNSFLSTYGQPAVEESRSDPPSSMERSKKVLFSKQLEVHEKQKTPTSAMPATPILRSGGRARMNLAPTPVRESTQKSSGRDPTPRAGQKTVSTVQSEKRRTINDLLNELPNNESEQDKTRSRSSSDPPLNRSRRPYYSNSIKSPRDIFSRMALRTTQSEMKASKKSMEPEAAQRLLRQAQLSHHDNNENQTGWDILELFPSTPQDVKKKSIVHRTPSSIEELLSQPPPPPPPREQHKSHLKTYESRNDHWDAPDLYSDSWNRYLKENSPSNASTESQDAFLIANRYQPNFNDRGAPSSDSSTTDSRLSDLRREQMRSAQREATSATKQIKTRHQYEQLEEILGEDKDDQGTEVVLMQRSDRFDDKDRGRKANETPGERKHHITTIQKRGAPRDPSVPFQQLSSPGMSFEESPALNKKGTDDTSETDSADEFNAKRLFSPNVDNDSTESPEIYDDNFELPRRRGRYKRKWRVVWLILCVVIVGLIVGLPLYFFAFDGAARIHSAETKASLKFDGCVDGFPDPAMYSSRYTTMRKIVMGTVDGEASRVDEAGAPQRKALCWLADFDKQIESIGGADIPAIIQRYTMAVLYYTLVPEGESSEKSLSKSDYLSSSHECEWSVVMCESSKTVTSLLLADKVLTGPLPAEIANLVNLSFLELSLNDISGEIPTSIQKLTLLEYLAVAFNSFSGTIPSEVGMLSKLEFLNMRSSQVHGRIPTELGGLSRLETLLLEGNWLSGTIPEHLGNLGQAQQMNFRENYLTGRVSSELCELRDISLVELNVDSWIECDCCTA